jgi:glutathione S-transferase
MSFELATDRPPVKPADTPLRIYSNPVCPFAQRAILAAAYTGVKHEVVFVHLKDKPQWFVDEINPFGKTPVIEHDGHLIRESLVTFDYIDEVFGNSKLWPTDPYKKAQSKLILNDFGEIFMPNYYKYYFNQVDENTSQNILKYLKSVEEVIGQYGGPFIMGDTASAIDFLIWPWFERLPAVYDAFSADGQLLYIMYNVHSLHCTMYHMND